MSGIELIAAEREEQKQRFFNDSDYLDKELMQAAIFTLTLDPLEYPLRWNYRFKDKIAKKSYQERLIKAGALIAAELDRLSE